jgi:microcystin-dependent protein
VHSVVDHSEGVLTTAYQNYTTDAITVLSTSINTLLDAKASLASPVLTGTPRSTTPAANDDSDRIATTAYTVDAVAALKTTIDGVLSGINDLINQTRPVPTGSVFYLATTIIPNGYLECNGSAVGRTTYAALWQALGSPNTGNGSTTFNLPDLRGEFIRGWDHGRGVDSNRNLGSLQADQFGAHTHQYNDTYYSEHWGSGEGPQVGSGRTDYDNYDYNKTRTTASSGGTETRPRNIALMPIIKW